MHVSFSPSKFVAGISQVCVMGGGMTLLAYSITSHPTMLYIHLCFAWVLLACKRGYGD